MNNEQILNIVCVVNKLLVYGRYDELQKATASVRLTEHQIREGIEEYPYHFIDPGRDLLSRSVKYNYLPGESSEHVDVFFVEFFLHTQEEGESDMTVRLVVYFIINQVSHVTLGDILVP